MLGVFRLIFSRSSEPTKEVLNEVKDEALSTFRFYRNLIAFGLGMFGVFLFCAIVALLKVIFGG